MTDAPVHEHFIMPITNYISHNPMTTTPNITTCNSSTAAKDPGISASGISVHGAIALDRKRPSADDDDNNKCHLAKKHQVEVDVGQRLGFVNALELFAPLFSLDFLGENLEPQPHVCDRLARKQVTFSEALTSEAPGTSVSDSFALNPGGTWYNDVDYHRFQLDSRKTVLVARQSLLTAGDLDDFETDPDSTLLGLEQFLSPTIERMRAQRCRTHVQRMLSRVMPTSWLKRQH